MVTQMGGFNFDIDTALQWDKLLELLFRLKVISNTQYNDYSHHMWRRV